MSERCTECELCDSGQAPQGGKICPDCDWALQYLLHSPLGHQEETFYDAVKMVDEIRNYIGEVLGEKISLRIPAVVAVMGVKRAMSSLQR